MNPIGRYHGMPTHRLAITAHILDFSDFVALSLNVFLYFPNISDTLKVMSNCLIIFRQSLCARMLISERVYFILHHFRRHMSDYLTWRG